MPTFHCIDGACTIHLYQMNLNLLTLFKINFGIALP